MTELSMTGVFHCTVNAGFIRWMHSKYTNNDLYFYAEKKHILNCIKLSDVVNINYRSFPFFPSAKKHTLLIRDFIGCFYAIWILMQSQKTDILFITNLLPVTHWCIYILNFLLKRQLYIALHGQMEALLPDTPLRFTKIYFRMHSSLLRCDKKNQYIILGEPIYETLKSYLGTGIQTIIMDHPFVSTPKKPCKSSTFPIRVGQIGVGNRGKGTENLFRLGELLYNEIDDKRLELLLIGCLDKELRNHTNPWVKWHEKPLPYDEYQLEISKLDYILLLRDRNTGRATPSGSFFDTINKGHHFIALRNPYIEYYMEKFSESVTLCESVEEMADEIRKILVIC